ncbi:hypothetical protein [Glaciimonas sp. PAMC28666]|uniref:hypothetical protein n=1 Tax=Glaciimonas sp. PAMC28666 TaxID=2807626 RepID=UPI0019636FC4|nr:hypothetical protein [Glaciimonas sp. PAMC28666]QRX82692.1 hypothetical protein JQN73_21995 [Glaciimonas sp. PAMC28666]
MTAITGVYLSVRLSVEIQDFTEVMLILYTILSQRKSGTGFATCNIQAHGPRQAVVLRVFIFVLFNEREWRGGFGLPVALYVGLQILSFSAHPVLQREAV